jgi:hypothetical protein
MPGADQLLLVREMGIAALRGLRPTQTSHCNGTREDNQANHFIFIPFKGAA